MKTTCDRKKLGQSAKRKGAYGQKLSAQFWQKILGGEIRSTPRSGAFWNFKCDLLAKKNIIAENPFVIEVKYGKTALPKRIKDQLQKLREDAEGDDCWLELIDPYGDTAIVMDKKIFAKLLLELQEWRKTQN